MAVNLDRTVQVQADPARDRWGAIAAQYKGEVAAQAAVVTKSADILDEKLTYAAKQNPQSDEAVLDVALAVIELRNQMVRFCELTGKAEDIKALDPLVVTATQAAGIDINNVDAVRVVTSKPMPFFNTEEVESPRFGG